MVRKTALEKMWTDSLDVIVQEIVVNTQNGRSEFVEKTVYQNIPCRLSFHTPSQAVRTARERGDYVTVAEQTVKLFLRPDVVIAAGSKIVVYRDGIEMFFARSGVPAIFDHHQELRVERFERWA